MTRSFTMEIMDTGDFTTKEYETCLRELGTINYLTMGYTPTLNAILEAAKLTKERPLGILDIGFGYGDTLREIAMWAKKNKIEVALHGIELNPLATDIARRLTPAELAIDFQTQNFFNLPSDQTFHIVMCALMTHHLNDEEVRALLQWMTERSTVAWFVNDLHRHWIAYLFIKILSRLMRFNRLIQNDGPLSVKRSFVRSEWVELIKASGLHLSRSKDSLVVVLSFRSVLRCRMR